MRRNATRPTDVAAVVMLTCNPARPPPDPWTEAMRQGNFASAFRLSDRILARRSRATRDDQTLPYHLRWVWDGRSFDGRAVLVRCYHGLGDTLQFCRYLAPLRRRARHLTLEAQPELLPLLQTLESVDVLRPFKPSCPSRPAECDFEIMELAHALRLAPVSAPYLSGAISRPGAKVRVGLAWQAGSWLPDRSIALSFLTPLLSVADIEFVNLQHRGMLAEGRDDGPTSVCETAARIASVDLVISVDTMVAHLAGALGVPLWLLLKAEPDWRWLSGGTASAWYANVRKYCQAYAGDWRHPIAAAAADLIGVAERGTLQTNSGS